LVPERSQQSALAESGQLALKASDLVIVSRLLDEALALDAADRDRWLQALPSEHARFGPVLREMLARAERSSDHLLAPRAIDTSPEQESLRVGDQVGPWRLMRKLGHGGM